MTELDLSLAQRTALPDALRVLVQELPREGWEAHDNYSGLIQFWLERHLLFRRLMEQLQGDAHAALDTQIDPRLYGRKLARFGGMLVNELHMHHQIEDTQFFPVLEVQDARVTHGFELLETDHQSIDTILHEFALLANQIISRPTQVDDFTDRCGAVLAQVDQMNLLLDRHLTDEEELVVPVLLKYAPDGMR